MKIREGLIPTVLGTAVTTTGSVLRRRGRTSPVVSAGIVGFGLAHVVLGVIDLIQHRDH